MRFLPLASVLLAILGWASMGASMYVYSIRSTLWPTWVLCAIAFALGIYSFAKVRPLGIAKGIAATLGVAMSALFVMNFFTGLSTPKEVGRVAAGDVLPPIALKTEDGKEFALPNGKPALLVFFRGFW